MEKGQGSKPQQKSTKRSSNTGVVIREPSDNSNIPIGINDPTPRQTFKRSSDQYLPMASVTRIMRSVLPSNAKISEDAKEIVQECVSEYISYITGEANQKCHQEHRKTIIPEDLLHAMGALGFHEHKEYLTHFLNKHRMRERMIQHGGRRHGQPSMVQPNTNMMNFGVGQPSTQFFRAPPLPPQNNLMQNAAPADYPMQSTLPTAYQVSSNVDEGDDQRGANVNDSVNAARPSLFDYPPDNI